MKLGAVKKSQTPPCARPAMIIRRDFFTAMSKIQQPDQENSVEVDLFGVPVGQVRDRWGRPSFAKSKENQQLVSLLRAAGWSQERIAVYMRCTEKTLRKHFYRELSAGADLIEGEALQVLFQKMRQGSIVSVKKVLEIIESGRAAPPVPKNDNGKSPRKLGKKEQAQLEAGNIPDGWGDVLTSIQ